MNPYQKLLVNDIETLDISQPMRGILHEIVDCLTIIVRERRNDVKDFDNLNQRFISGRKVGKIPTGAADVDPTDRVGDFNYTTQYLYILVDNAGTAEWRRSALSSW